MMCFLGIRGFNTVLIIRFIMKRVLNRRLGCTLKGCVCLDFIVKAVLLGVLNHMSTFYC